MHIKSLVGLTLAVICHTAVGAIQPIPKEQSCSEVGHPGRPIQDRGPGDYEEVVSGHFNDYDVNMKKFVYFVTEWNRRNCRLDDGRPALGALLPGYDARFNLEARMSGDWSKSLKILSAFKTEYPNAPFVAAAEAQYWIAYAWHARGSGYSSSVAGDGWKLFRERLEKAERILIDTKSYAAKWPHWYEQMIQVQFLLDRPQADQDQTFEEGAKRFPTYYPIYFAKMWSMLPRWGGSWDAIDDLANWAEKNTEKSEGKALYARIYWAVAGSMRADEQVFTTTKAKWGRMKAGFDDLLRRTPNSSWNLNNYAQFACEAGDAKTFQALRKRLGQNVIQEAWERGNSVELCDAKFGAKG